ncbi:hypothetical protein [Tsukamurella tyrosinosolvens]|nr:hypothetical protein [Tsukamurella tyrosinosolvens]
MDTSTFTHFHRAGVEDLLLQVAPHGSVVLIPAQVETEIERGRDRYPSIPGIDNAQGYDRVFLTNDEYADMLTLQIEMDPETPEQHIGECAVIACATARKFVAVLDERVAFNEALDRGLIVHDTIWILIACHVLAGVDRAVAEAAVDSLLETVMDLPINDGTSLFPYAYEIGYLPWEHGAAE